MAQVFRYPNLVAGTDEWTDWWTPLVGVDNSTATCAAGTATECRLEA